MFSSPEKTKYKRLDEICAAEAATLKRPVVVPSALLTFLDAIEAANFGIPNGKSSDIRESYFLKELYEMDDDKFIKYQERKNEFLKDQTVQKDLSGLSVDFLAYLVKQFLGNLPVRILDTADVRAMIAIATIENNWIETKAEIMRELLLEMPPPYYQTFVALLRHWKKCMETRECRKGNQAASYMSLAECLRTPDKRSPLDRDARALERFDEKDRKPTARLLFSFVKHIDILAPERLGVPIEKVYELEGNAEPNFLDKLMLRIHEGFVPDNPSQVSLFYPGISERPLRVFFAEDEHFQECLTHESVSSMLRGLYVHLNTDPRFGEESEFTPGRFHPLISSLMLRSFLNQLPVPVLTAKETALIHSIIETEQRYMEAYGFVADPRIFPQMLHRLRRRMGYVLAGLSSGRLKLLRSLLLFLIQLLEKAGEKGITRDQLVRFMGPVMFRNEPTYVPEKHECVCMQLMKDCICRKKRKDAPPMAPTREQHNEVLDYLIVYFDDVVDPVRVTRPKRRFKYAQRKKKDKSSAKEILIDNERKEEISRTMDILQVNQEELATGNGSSPHANGPNDEDEPNRNAFTNGNTQERDSSRSSSTSDDLPFATGPDDELDDEETDCSDDEANDVGYTSDDCSVASNC